MSNTLISPLVESQSNKVVSINSNFGILDGTFNVLPKTANYSVTEADFGTTFTNGGASGTVIFSLPVPVAGMEFTFMIYASHTVEILAAGGTAINIGSGSSSSGGNASANTVGYSLTLKAISNTNWFAKCHEGTWTLV